MIRLKNKINLYKCLKIFVLFFIPVVYAGLYLWAFWDPYNLTSSIPVAVVNNDIGGIKDNEYKNFGNDVINKLKDDKNIKWDFVNEDIANWGLDNKKYYSVIIIPEDFTDNILSVNTNNPIKTEIILKNRESINLLASKIINRATYEIVQKTNHSVIEEYFEEMFNDLRSKNDVLYDGVGGSKDLYDGLVVIKDGSLDLKNGSDKAFSGAKKLKNGLEVLVDGSSSLDSGISNARDAVYSLKSGTFEIKSGLDYLAKNSDKMTPEEIKESLVKLSSSQEFLLSGTEELYKGLVTLESGSAQLNSGLRDAYFGSKDLNNGLEKIRDGNNDLYEGTLEAVEGSEELKDKLNETYMENLIDLDISKTNIKKDVMSKPVDMLEIPVNPVKNYGTGFAPYFIPLGLWVGAMSIFFIFEPLKESSYLKLLVNYLFLSMIGVCQAIVLNIVLTKILGLEVLNLREYYILTILMSLFFVAIFQFLMNLFGDLGRFIGVILLMVQLSSGAGSFPKETLPLFLQKIGNYMPMTYLISTLRDLISVNDSFAGKIDLYLIYGISSLVSFTVFIKGTLYAKIKNSK